MQTDGTSLAARTNPISTGKGRQLISSKLDRIRLDTVMYDGLPLGEVVRNLYDEARNRDPDKRGINFIINPNPEVAPPPFQLPPVIDPTTGLPTHTPQPQELVDINAVTIRIRPALRDVRLADVLDAIVKVADHPIKYTIEDYGVVFALKGFEPESKDEPSFFFPGGDPGDFLKAVDEHYKVDWRSIAQIPDEMRYVQVPKLRIPGQAHPPRPGEPPRPDELTALVVLYHRLAERNPQLGNLVVEGDPRQPSVVMFVPEKTSATAQPQVKVKAFSLKGIPEKEWARLSKDIELTRDEGMQYEHVRQYQAGSRSKPTLDGRVSIHNDTGLLVAIGAEPYVEMVESIVAVHQENQSTNAKPSPEKK